MHALGRSLPGISGEMYPKTSSPLLTLPTADVAGQVLKQGVFSQPRREPGDAQDALAKATAATLALHSESYTHQTASQLSLTDL